LLLGAYKEDGATIFDDFLDIFKSIFKELDGLVEVNDIDPVSRAIDVASHFRVPFSSWVSKVDSCLEQFFHAELCHIFSGFASKAVWFSRFKPRLRGTLRKPTLCDLALVLYPERESNG
jgi:hypothetical protein